MGVGEKTITTFYAKNPYQAKELDVMAEILSRNLRVGPEVIRQLGQKALYEWEVQHEKSVSNIFNMEGGEKLVAIQNIVENFNRMLAPIVDSEKRMNRVVQDTFRYFIDVFHREEPTKNK